MEKSLKDQKRERAASASKKSAAITLAAREKNGPNPSHYRRESSLHGLDLLRLTEIIPYPVSGLNGYAHNNLQPWDRQIAPNGAEEPNRWYYRFEAFRQLGPARYLLAAYRACVPGHPANVDGAWHKVAKLWRWRERSEAWDRYVIETFRETELQRLHQARRQRIERLGTIQEVAFDALLKADLSNLTRRDALEHLSAIRSLLFDSMKAEHLEYGEATGIEGDAGPVFNSDDMVQYTKRLEEWRGQRALPR